MASTDLTGLWAECLSALARGGAGTVVGAMAGMGAAAGVMARMAVGHTDVASPAAADTLDGDMLDEDMLGAADTHVAVVDFTVEQPAVAEGSMVAAASTVEVEVDSTVAVDTVAVVGTAAGTGKLAQSLI